MHVFYLCFVCVLSHSSPSGPKPYIASETMRLVKQMDEEEKVYGRPNHPPPKSSKPRVGRVLESSGSSVGPVPLSTSPNLHQQIDRASPVLGVTSSEEERRHSTGIRPKLLNEPERRFSTETSPKQSLYRPIPKPYTPPVLTSSQTSSLASSLDRVAPITSVSLAPKTIRHEAGSPLLSGSEGTPSRYMSTVVVEKNRPTIQITNDVLYGSGSEPPTMNLDVTVGEAAESAVEGSPLYKLNENTSAQVSQPPRSVIELTAQFQAPQTDPAPIAINKSPRAKIEIPSKLHSNKTTHNTPKLDIPAAFDGPETTHTTPVITEPPRVTINIAPKPQHLLPSNGYVPGTNVDKPLQIDTSSNTITEPLRASIHIPTKVQPSEPSTDSAKVTLIEKARAKIQIPSTAPAEEVTRTRGTESAASRPPESLTLKESARHTIKVPGKVQDMSRNGRDPRSSPQTRGTPPYQSGPAVDCPETVTLNEPPRITINIPGKFQGSSSTTNNDTHQVKASVVRSKFERSTTPPSQVTINQALRATEKITTKVPETENTKETSKPKEPGKIKIPGKFTKSDLPSSSDQPRKGLKIPTKFQVPEPSSKLSTINVAPRETIRVSPKSETSKFSPSSNSSFQPYRAPTTQHIEPPHSDLSPEDFPPPPPTDSSDELGEYMPSEFPPPPLTEAADCPDSPTTPDLPPPPPLTDQPLIEPAKMEPKQTALYEKYADLLQTDDHGPVQSRTFNVLSSMVDSEPGNVMNELFFTFQGEKRMRVTEYSFLQANSYFDTSVVCIMAGSKLT